MPSEKIISIENLQVKFGKNAVIPNLNLSLEPGRIIGLLGPSGSGKTTLVKSMMGMNNFSGKITILGQNVPSLKLSEKIGYMAQSDALYEDLSAIDNTLFFPSMFGLTRKKARQRAGDLLSFVNLENDSKKLVRNFSGGMKRRLSLAICLMHEPKILILDEPTAGIDPLLREKFWNKFIELKNNGCTIFVTTHVMDEANKCDIILLLKEGQIIANGSVDELYAVSGKNNVEDVFLYFEKDGGEETAL